MNLPELKNMTPGKPSIKRIQREWLQTLPERVREAYGKRAREGRVLARACGALNKPLGGRGGIKSIVKRQSRERSKPGQQALL